MGDIQQHIVTVNSLYSFSKGDSFSTFDGFENRLERHTKEDLVYYWTRDSRTVQGATSKTSRAIAPQLKYFYIRYSCIYGGQKFSSRARGLRLCKNTLRTECPAFILLRASDCGQKLVVFDVCNQHNHATSPLEAQRLAHSKKLSGPLKELTKKMLWCKIDRACIREYIRRESAQELTAKDLCNLDASVKRSAIYQRPPTSEEITEMWSLLQDIPEMVKCAPLEIQHVSDIATEQMQIEVLDEAGNEEEHDTMQYAAFEDNDDNKDAAMAMPALKAPASVVERRIRWKTYCSCPVHPLLKAQLKLIQAKRAKLVSETQVLRLKKQKLLEEIKQLRSNRQHF